MPPQSLGSLNLFPAEFLISNARYGFADGRGRFFPGRAHRSMKLFVSSESGGSPEHLRLLIHCLRHARCSRTRNYCGTWSRTWEPEHGLPLDLEKIGLVEFWSGLRGVWVDGLEIELAGNQEEDCFHGLQAGVSARLSFGGLEQSIDGFDEAVGLA